MNASSGVSSPQTTVTTTITNTSVTHSSSEKTNEHEKESKSAKTSNKRLINITAESPLFVLSLPNSGSNALYRYFTCGGYQPDVELGRHFTNRKKARKQVKALKEIGTCMASNIMEKQQQAPLEKCAPTGKPFLIWMDMEVTRFNRCFYPALAPGALEALYQQYPQSTILQIVRDPQEWYETLSFDIREKWDDMCNENHPGVSFPGNTSTKQKWIQFYQFYVDQLRDFAKQHSSLNYIEIPLQTNIETANLLQERLGIKPDCWVNSFMESTQEQEQNQRLQVASPPSTIPRPSDITYPILLVSLSKSGTTTTHDYFTCGMGGGASIHQWTKNHTTKSTTLIGKCMEYNIQHDRPLLEECSYYRVWTDIQYVLRNGGPGGKKDWSRAKCFFPQFLSNGGLQNFYKYYPNATIMNTVRNATSWIRSANRWDQIQERWAAGAECHGFPPTNSSEDVWVEFYNNQNEQIRQFAKEHPSLTYVEVSLELKETSSILQEIFGFPEACWGHSNVNTGIKTAG